MPEEGRREVAVNIRKMTIRDYDEVYALWLSCPGLGLNDVDDSRRGIEKFLQRNADTCFVAEEQGLAGAILAGHDGRRGYIYHTAVRPERQGRGIGSRLVEAVLAAFAHQGIAKAATLVFAANRAGNDFWQRLGFTDRPDLVYRNLALTEMKRIDT